jgi:pantoate--beta-alanine ligase
MPASNLSQKFETVRGLTMTTLFTDLNSYSEWRKGIPADKTVGFVPTMGALHTGHVSLMRAASAHCDVVVVSIYVNELQFNSASDFQHYPRTQNDDVDLCVAANADVVFAPSKSDMFVERDVKILQPSHAADNFEGLDRPGHFAGVVTVVDRLFSVVSPTRAYFGIKDYQQVAVISDMSSQLHPDIEIVICETEREHDGLAMSSRNRFLSEAARVRAALLPTALTSAITQWKNGATQTGVLIEAARAILTQDPTINVQYISIVRAGSMDPVQTVSALDVIIAAVVIDGIRLIDNMSFPIA